MNFLILLAIGLAPGFVYLDATKHKIGKVKGEKGMANMSAGAWALCTLGLTIIALPDVRDKTARTDIEGPDASCEC